MRIPIQKLKENTENLETLLHEKSELQSHLSSLGLMIGSISHGIKGLLTGLDGGMYLLDSGFAKENRDQVKEGSGQTGGGVMKTMEHLLNCASHVPGKAMAIYCLLQSSFQALI